MVRGVAKENRVISWRTASRGGGRRCRVCKGKEVEGVQGGGGGGCARGEEVEGVQGGGGCTI